MKKKLYVTCIAICCATLLTAFSPSVDGRAIVAGKGELPSGLFAKTVGYLPGDTVSVTNPTSGKSIDILVVGSLDPSEGVAIQLSADAASELGIKKDENNVVRLTKRTGKLDESVYGTAIVSPAVSEAVPEEVAETPAATEDVTPAASAVASSDILETVVADTSESAPVLEEVPVVAEKPAEEVPEQVNTTLSEPEQTEPETVVTEPAPVVAIVPDPETAAEPELSESVDENVPSESVDESTPAEPVSEVSSGEKVDEEKLPEESLPAEIVAESVPDKVDTAEPELAPVDPVVSSENEEYAPIVLVPSEPKTPADVVNEDEPEETPVEDSPVVALIPEEQPEVVEQATKPVVPASATGLPADLSKYERASLSDLESGKYYVQIAVLAKQDNIRNNIAQYGKTYPIVLVPLTSGKAYQVMIGPLGKDEYGTVLARFKSTSDYKGSFVRKIK
ncbi:MAG: SPOR domain-containing protein [Treponema sp.]|nr:SPOR domain-containing protein [Treponema sp.]